MILTLLLTLLLPGAQPAPAAPQRFDMLVRNDLFAGFAGNQAALERGMAACAQALAANPQNAEALVWHGAGLGLRERTSVSAGRLRKRRRAVDARDGGDGQSRGARARERRRPDTARRCAAAGDALHADSRPRGRCSKKRWATTSTCSRCKRSYFSTLGDHPKGELLFGLAEGYSRLGRLDKARVDFEQLTKDAPASGHAPAATLWLADGTPPAVKGLGCVGCHK